MKVYPVEWGEKEDYSRLGNSKIRALLLVHGISPSES